MNGSTWINRNGWIGVDDSNMMNPGGWLDERTDGLMTYDDEEEGRIEEFKEATLVKQSNARSGFDYFGL